MNTPPEWLIIMMMVGVFGGFAYALKLVGDVLFWAVMGLLGLVRRAHQPPAVGGESS